MHLHGYKGNTLGRGCYLETLQYRGIELQTEVNSGKNFRLVARRRRIATAVRFGASGNGAGSTAMNLWVGSIGDLA